MENSQSPTDNVENATNLVDILMTIHNANVEDHKDLRKMTHAIFVSLGMLQCFAMCVIGEDVMNVSKTETILLASIAKH